MDDSVVVQVVESSFVAPSERTPSKALWLSPLDLMQANRSHTPTLYLYSPDDTAADFFDVTRLKESMAKALVHFYPLAGRLGIGDDGRTEITCNGEGALFVVARSDLTVDDIRDMKPSPELRSLVVPRIDPPSIILAIQVIFLKCGGVAIGTAMHHAAIDASSALHFFQTWSAISRNISNGKGGGAAAAVEIPCHDRTLLRARSPPTVHPDALSKFYPKVTLSEPSGPIASAVFSISGDQVASLRRLCGGATASTFCAVGALVWQCQCTCLARRLSPESEARVIFPVNIRRKMRPPLPDRYFGNALIRVCAAGAVGDVASEALASVAGRIRGAISQTDDALVHSAIDYFEMAQAEVLGSRPLKGAMPETDLHIISWLGTPMHDADFGWGKPQVMTRAESVRGGFVYLMNDGADSGGVRVLMSLEAENLKEMERLLYAKL